MGFQTGNVQKLPNGRIGVWLRQPLIDNEKIHIASDGVVPSSIGPKENDPHKRKFSFKLLQPVGEDPEKLSPV